MGPRHSNGIPTRLYFDYMYAIPFGLYLDSKNNIFYPDRILPDVHKDLKKNKRQKWDIFRSQEKSPKNVRILQKKPHKRVLGFHAFRI